MSKLVIKGKQNKVVIDRYSIGKYTYCDVTLRIEGCDQFIAHIEPAKIKIEYWGNCGCLAILSFDRNDELMSHFYVAGFKEEIEVKLEE